mgnify:CR=1 FL=1
MSVFVLASCATSSDVVDGGLFQKRKYNKGWNFNKKSKIESTNGTVKDLAIVEVEKKQVIESNSEVNSVVEYVVSDAHIETSTLPVKEVTEASVSNVTNDSPISKEEEILAEVSNKKEQRVSRKEVKKSVRSNFNFGLSKNTSSSNETTGADILLVILAILIPPLAVGLYEGITTRFWIDLLLTLLLFYLPGMIFALLIVLGAI